MTELGQRESGDRVIIAVPWPIPECKAVEHVVCRRHPVKEQRSILAFDDIRRFILAIRQIAGNRFKEIGLRDNALKDSIFIDDDRKPHGSLLEHIQHPEYRHGFKNEQRLPDHP
jgi:hypothetical protein